MFGAALILLLTQTLLSTGIAAQTDSATPPASDCGVSPRTIEAIVDLAGSPAAAATPVSQDDSLEIDQAGVEDLVWDLVACANANSPLQWLALFTDRYVAERFGPEHPDDLASLGAALTRKPAPAAAQDALHLIQIEEIRPAGDGSVSVTVTTANRENTFVDELIVVREHDEIRIDSVKELDTREPPETEN